MIIVTAFASVETAVEARSYLEELLLDSGGSVRVRDGGQAITVEL